MKKLVCLALALCLLLCAAGAWAATVNGYPIESGARMDWQMNDGILSIKKAGKYVIENWTGKQIYVDPNDSEEITLELRKVTLDNDGYFALVHMGKGKLTVDLDAGSSVLTGVRARRTDSNPIHVELSGSGTIKGISNGVALVSEGGGSITADVSGSLTITGGYGLFAQSDKEDSGNSGAVTVRVSDSVKITGKSFQGIHASSESDKANSGAVNVTVSGGVEVTSYTNGISAQSKAYEGKSGSVSVSVSGGAKVSGENSGIYAARGAKDPTEDEDDMVSVSVDGAVVTGGASGISIYDEIKGNKNVGEMSVTVSGGAQIIGESKNGVELSSELTDQDAVTVTLQDNAAVQGESGAIGFMNDHGKVFVNASKPTAFYIDEVHQDDYDSKEDVTGIVKGAQKLRLGEVLVNDGAGVAGESEPDAVADLPQTGDSSRLALWGAMLAIALAGMMTARKREA